MRKNKKITKTKVRSFGGISITKPDRLKFLQTQLESNLERNKMRYYKQRSGLSTLVAKHPVESVATIRHWMLEIG